MPIKMDEAQKMMHENKGMTDFIRKFLSGADVAKALQILVYSDYKYEEIEPYGSQILTHTSLGLNVLKSSLRIFERLPVRESPSGGII